MEDEQRLNMTLDGRQVFFKDDHRQKSEHNMFNVIAKITKHKSVKARKCLLFMLANSYNFNLSCGQW